MATICSGCPRAELRAVRLLAEAVATRCGERCQDVEEDAAHAIGAADLTDIGPDQIGMVIQYLSGRLAVAQVGQARLGYRQAGG